MTKLESAGWITFLVGAVLFLVASLRNGDPLSIAGSVLFTIGIVLFLVPLASQLGRSGRRRTSRR